ncbi:MAG: DUF3160 domain-containing protein [Prevotella sp.]|nr:DUF3160 domain-containing protein [Prevotella sp.]
MKKNLFIITCAALTIGCSQQQHAVAEVPPSQLNVEKLRGDIDYDMDVSGLSLSDLRILRNAPAAQRGYPFKDGYLRSIYSSTTWYDSLMWSLDEKLPWKKYEVGEKEDWKDYYYRVINESNAMRYTAKELAFMKRLQTRVEELRKQNFKVPQGLRVNMANITNPRIFTDIAPALAQRLGEDGFAIVATSHPQLFQVYEQNDYANISNFVTTDLFLQLFHLYVDCMLRKAEQQVLSPLMTEMASGLFQDMQRLANSTTRKDIRAYAQHNAQYFAIACELLTGKAVSNDPLVREEVDKAMKAVDASSRFMEDYREIKFGYSLFRPRGHYTRSETLQRYFRGMMWLQSVPFGMDNDEEVCEAVVMADALSKNAKAMANFQRFDRLITWLMGKADNLSIPQVQAEMKRIGMPLEALLDNRSKITELKTTLEKIGNEQTRIRPIFEKTSHNKICLMPQRYQPDAEVLLHMVDYKNEPTLRDVPKGLDFFAAMGVSQAEQLLLEEKTDWKEFTSTLKKMKERMSEIDWQETIATQWMNTLKAISDKDQDKSSLPYFMQNPAWEKKDLNAMLASWAELKHDAILYAKQPAGAECGGGGPPEPVFKGYVEPNVKFWQKAVGLLDNIQQLLEREQLSEKIELPTEAIKSEAEFLLSVSQKELAGKKLSDEEYNAIEIIGSTFENISLDLVREPNQYLMGWSDVQGADKQVALVADVYTANADNNPNKSILFEAVGNADEIYVVVEIEGYLYVTKGAVFSYREFIQPINEPRLTDEEWQKLLETNPRKGVPEWMKRIIVPVNKQPEANDEVFYSSGC